MISIKIMLALFSGSPVWLRIRFPNSTYKYEILGSTSREFSSLGETQCDAFSTKKEHGSSVNDFISFRL